MFIDFQEIWFSEINFSTGGHQCLCSSPSRMIIMVGCAVAGNPPRDFGEADYRTRSPRTNTGEHRDGVRPGERAVPVLRTQCRPFGARPNGNAQVVSPGKLTWQFETRTVLSGPETGIVGVP